MGMDPLSLGLTVGGLSAASTLVSGLASSQQANARGQAQAAQAEQLRQQAKTQAQAGQLELENIDRQRAALTREYRSRQSANAVSLGVGNVDPSSGSAMDVALGNADRFAGDIGDNAYTRAVRHWETREQIKATTHQANLLDSQASYARQTANNLLPTLLGTALSGTTSFLHGYSWAGGKIGTAKKP